MTAPFVRDLVDAATAPYRAADRFAWRFAKGKLGGDPVFAGLLQHGLLSGRRHVLDIGCGQGLLASWLLAASAAARAGKWPADWPAAPAPESIHGIELMPRDVLRAQRALAGTPAAFRAGDMCRTDFGSADAVVILDVLHYVSHAAQDDVLRRIRDALRAGGPDGVLLLRVGDADGGLRFRYSVLVDHIVTVARGHRPGRMHCRPLAQWKQALGALGFQVEAMPMHKGTPFANILLVARLTEAQQSRPASQPPQEKPVTLLKSTDPA